MLKIRRNRIKKLLEERELSKTQLASMLMMSPKTMDRYIANERQPSMTDVLKIADIFQIGLTDVIYYD